MKTLWMYFREGLVRAHKNRPTSFYLLLSIPVVLALGSRMAEYRDHPKHFAFYLGLIFIFFFVVLLSAIVDFIEIARRHFKENEGVFRSTLGDQQFLSELAERLEEGRKE